MHTYTISAWNSHQKYAAWNTKSPPPPPPPPQPPTPNPTPPPPPSYHLTVFYFSARLSVTKISNRKYRDYVYIKYQSTKYNVLHHVKITNLLSVQTRFPTSGPTYRRQVVNPRHRTPQGKSFAKPGTPLQNILVVKSEHAIKESERNMLYPIFKETVQVRKHPGCAFAEPELIESIKTTSMEDVSTRVLEKIKNV